MVEIWLRSIKTRSLRYTTLVGDGDSSCFGKVREACTNKYGNSYRVEKEECVGHIQKRMGTGLREFKRKRSGQKLADGKGVGGMYRLTLAAMDRMQNNYGEAIRSHANATDMKTAILAVFHHMIKDDKLPLSSTNPVLYIQSPGVNFGRTDYIVPVRTVRALDCQLYLKPS